MANTEKEITACGNFIRVNSLNYLCLIKQLGLWRIRFRKAQFRKGPIPESLYQKGPKRSYYFTCVSKNKLSYELGSEKIALNSFVYIAYKTHLMPINKGKGFILGLILSRINAFQLVLVQFCVSFIGIQNKKIS